MRAAMVRTAITAIKRVPVERPLSISLVGIIINLPPFKMCKSVFHTTTTAFEAKLAFYFAVAVLTVNYINIFRRNCQ